LNCIFSIFRSITSIENLSNELFHEIFDYLDGCDIYKAFFNLNYRFQHLITSPSFPLKIKLRSEGTLKLIESCKNVIIPNRHHILSLNFANRSVMDNFFTNCIIDSSFCNLQSIVLKNDNIDKCMVPIFYFKSLPHLLSLTIHIDGQEDYDLNNIYRMIFSFPSLKYIKVSLFPSNTEDDDSDNSEAKTADIRIPLCIYEKSSTIQYLIINHRCNLEELFSIISHTPQLRRLTCRNLLEAQNDLSNTNQITLFNLTHVYIDIVNIGFIDYEMFFDKIFAPIQILRIKDHENPDYSDANNWEQLIKRYIPHLCRFNYEFHEHNPFEDDNIDFFMKINQFTSPFWIQRQWFFQFTIHMNDQHVSGLIHPYRYIN
jgi:hypothetical protein